MRYKLLFLLLLISYTGLAQGVYKYKNIEVTATSPNGDVEMDSLGNYSLTDSVLSIRVMPGERNFFTVAVVNKSTNAIRFRWKASVMVGLSTNFNAVLKSIDDENLVSGVDEIYSNGLRIYEIKSRINYAFSKKPKDEEVSIALPFIIDDKEKIYVMNFKANVLK